MSTWSVGSRDWVQVCPASPKHRTVASGEIEIEGRGIVTSPPKNYWGDLEAISLVHEKYGNLLAESAARAGIPYVAALAIAVVEGGWKRPNFVNDAGAGGVMAITPGAFKEVRGRMPSRQEMLDPATNIDVGVHFFALKLKKYGELPAAAAAYNAGAKICSPTSKCNNSINGKWQHDGTSAKNSWGMVEDCTAGHGSAYARRAVEVMNTAIDKGLSLEAEALTGDEKPGSVWLAVFLGGAAVAGLYYYTRSSGRR